MIKEQMEWELSYRLDSLQTSHCTTCQIIERRASLMWPTYIHRHWLAMPKAANMWRLWLCVCPHSKRNTAWAIHTKLGRCTVCGSCLAWTDTEVKGQGRVVMKSNALPVWVCVSTGLLSFSSYSLQSYIICALWLVLSTVLLQTRLDYHFWYHWADCYRLAGRPSRYLTYNNVKALKWICSSSNPSIPHDPLLIYQLSLERRHEAHYDASTTFSLQLQCFDAVGWAAGRASGL